MRNTSPRNLRALGLAPGSYGLGYAILEQEGSLADWGVKRVRKNKNPESLAKIEFLLKQYQPGFIILRDTEIGRRPRIQELGKSIRDIAAKWKIKVVSLTRAEVGDLILQMPEATKHVIAQFLANRFPEELGKQLPRKRQPWESEDGRMAIFDAVAAVLAHWLKTSDSVQSEPS